MENFSPSESSDLYKEIELTKDWPEKEKIKEMETKWTERIWKKIKTLMSIGDAKHDIIIFQLTPWEEKKSKRWKEMMEDDD